MERGLLIIFCIFVLTFSVTVQSQEETIDKTMSCDSSYDCKKNYDLSKDYICYFEKTYGTNGYCRTKLENGGMCHGETDCLSNYCENYKCKLDPYDLDQVEFTYEPAEMIEPNNKIITEIEDKECDFNSDIENAVIGLGFDLPIIKNNCQIANSYLKNFIPMFFLQNKLDHFGSKFSNPQLSSETRIGLLLARKVFFQSADQDN